LDERVGDEEGSRQVHNDPVDLPGVEGRDGIVLVVVHAGILGRLNVVHDVVVRRRPQRSPQLVRAELLDGGRLGDRRSLHRDERLVHLVIRVAEVHRLVASWLVRHLVDEEVEVLLTGLERLGERDLGPLNLLRREAEPLGDRVRDGALEPLAVVGIVDLPR
jgi:hypothetical protein